MSKFVKVNWNELRKMQKSSLDNSEQFENARQKLLEIINSLNDCWEGIDYDNFIVNCTNYLNELKNDSLYFEAIGRYFEMGADTYNGVIDNHYEKINKIQQDISETKEIFDSISNETNFVGEKYE